MLPKNLISKLVELIKPEASPKREQYLMDRCHGCGRCDFGECPVKVKRKIKV